MNQKEKLFFDQLKDIFIGAKIRGKSGFINLMRIKSAYFDVIFKELNKDIEEKTKDFPEFKEEMFDKLYTFFKTYFSESGSIYFIYTPLKSKVYERIYSPEKDVMLFWKTHMLYYVKTDRLWNNLTIDFDEDGVRYKINFDVSKLQHKRANEKREIIYELKQIENKEITFDVLYSERGRKTKIDEILKIFKKGNIHLDEERLTRIFKIYERQNEIDYFINKNAEQFLKEQFDLWLKNYLFDDESDFSERRLKQLKVLKEIAYKVIDFVAQFEDELVKIWNKPKFVLNSNYVIALKTLKEYVTNKEYKEILSEVLKNIEKNQLYRQELIEVIKEIYKKPLENIYVKNVSLRKNPITQKLVFNLSYAKRFTEEKKYKEYLKKQKLKNGKKEVVEENGKETTYFYADYDSQNLTHEVDIEKLYIDTKFFDDDFKFKLLKFISKKVGIDNALDGYLIKSDNYHALKTILHKFREKIKLIYIDPPFNTEQSGFIYVDKFFDSSWLSMMNDRIEASLPLLKEDGSFYIHSDHNCNYLIRLLLDNIFGRKPLREIVWNTSEVISGFKSKAKNWIRQHDTIFYYSKSDNPHFHKLFVPYKCDKPDEVGWLDLFEDENGRLYIERYSSDSKKLERVYVNVAKTMAVGDVWNDILSLMYTQNMVRENWGQDNTQKPENLLRRIIQSSTDQREWVLDFFCGSGTTVVAAHKLGRRWIGIEMGYFFEDITLKRMKCVIFGDIRPKLSEDLNWQGGGFFKYYDLEQYEQTLRKAVYKPSHPFVDFDDKSIYQQYVFMKDLKLLDAMKLDYEDNKIKINFDEIYPNIDLAETLSNLTGKWIKKIEKNAVVFEDGSKIYYVDIDFNLIKLLIWW